MSRVVLRSSIGGAGRSEPALNLQASRVELQLAMAAAIEEALEAGRYKSQAEVARALGVSAARVSQVLNRSRAVAESSSLREGAKEPRRRGLGSAPNTGPLTP